MDFAELIFTSLIRISAINPKSKHYVTFVTPRDSGEMSRSGEPKRLYVEKLSRLPALREKPNIRARIRSNTDWRTPRILQCSDVFDYG